MDNITSTVAELWDFVVPPLFKLALAIGLLAWLAPPIYKQTLDCVRDFGVKIGGKVDTHPMIKSLGLEKLLPAVGVFVIILLIYAGNKLILGIGWRLPIDIVTIQPATLLHHTPKERLIQLWSLHPDLEFWDLPTALDNDLHSLVLTHGKEILSNVQYWEKTYAAVTQWFYTVKFLIFFSIFLCIIQIRRKLNNAKIVRRTVMGVIVMFFALIILVGKMLYCQNQLVVAKEVLLVSALPLKDSKPTVIAEVRTKLDKVEMAQGQRTWWEVRFVDSYSWIAGIKYLAGESIYNERMKYKFERRN